MEYLRAQIEEAAASLPGVVQKKAFGSDGFFVTVPGAEKPTLFAMAFRGDERIAVKLTNREDYDTLMSWPGSRVWTPHGDRVMPNWVLVPESFHDDTDALRPWVKKAYDLAFTSPRKAPAAKPAARAAKAGAKSPAKKPAAKAGAKGPAKKPAAKKPAARAATAKTAATKTTPRKTAAKASSGSSKTRTPPRSK